MKKLLFFLFITTITFAQSNTEVYLYEIINDNGNWSVGKGKNISNNPGYDSQPHFYFSVFNRVFCNISLSISG